MTPASFTYVALGLHVAVGLPAVWASAAVVTKGHVRLPRVFLVFGLLLLSGLVGVALVMLLGRLWLAVFPSDSTAQFSVLLTSIIGTALLVFAVHSAILRRTLHVSRQIAMLTVALMWVFWYIVASFATQVGATILL